ncbi:hypothetical protein THMIRHAS_20350 [Thiosulfatimonas sediminis]|uniref:DUF302 domain-containing protein n=1 Tax=Thiosulfatimonas sediminis TaxID=2675054 RepID=A0A6F8PWX9_9GAMM|nr:DUF302 domain-containing protein [Thiosulfatimonas sediminis]BBP46662.1 hypothetical protein THMIRHAS_20350 [Thiosulfatimonas sediminis]
MKLANLFKAAILTAGLATLSGCGTMNAATNLEEGAWGTFNEIWDRWVESEGDIGQAVVWEKKVAEGVSLDDVIDAINAVGIARNIKNVGELPLSEELKARGRESGVIHVMSFCNPDTARDMLDFSPAMGAMLPCRVTIVEQADGLYLYTMNMDMMVKMGKKMPSELKEKTMAVRDTIWMMMDKGSRGEF